METPETITYNMYIQWISVDLTTTGRAWEWNKIKTYEDFAMEQTNRPCRQNPPCHDAVQQLELKMMLCVRHGVFQATDLS